MCTSVSENVKFWYPELEGEEFGHLASELNAQPRQSQEFKSAESSSPWESLEQIEYIELSPRTGKVVKFEPETLPDSEPAKLFFIKLNLQDPDEKSSFLVHQATLKLWNNQGPTSEEFERWFSVLKYAALAEQPALRISVLYDLKSLRIKFDHTTGFHEKIRTFEEQLEDLMWSNREAFSNLAWAREILFPFLGFGSELGNLDSLKTLIKMDQIFYTALTSASTSDVVDAFEIIKNEFHEYNSYKRMIALAVYFHAIIHSSQSLMVRERFINLFAYERLLPNEVALMKYIAIKHGLPIPAKRF